MDVKNLILAVLLLLSAVLYYLLHRSWLKLKKNNIPASKQLTKIEVWKGWMLIIVSVILSIVYFYKSFN